MFKAVTVALPLLKNTNAFFFLFFCFFFVFFFSWIPRVFEAALMCTLYDTPDIDLASDHLPVVLQLIFQQK